jgi:hypothetical protein
MSFPLKLVLNVICNQNNIHQVLNVLKKEGERNTKQKQKGRRKQTFAQK